MSGIKSIELNEVKLPLKNPFETSFGVQKFKYAIIVKLEDYNGNVGWGESSLENSPGYCYETTKTAWYIQKEFLIPSFFEMSQDKLPKIEQLLNGFKKVRGHEFAKTGIESAYWSLKASQAQKSLGDYYKSTKKKIPTGVSLGIQRNLNELLSKISDYTKRGYQRIKIKIKPGWDVQIVKAIRKEFGDIQLMVDANSAYSLKEKDTDIMKRLDRYELTMIEQPLHYLDILEHKKLQKLISTPLCLDESIHTIESAILAIEEECCKIINIKPGRVGGYYNGLQIAEKLGKDVVWCGGMLETGVGRLHNLFFQANENFTIPGDTSGSNRYFNKDIISPEIEVDSDGYITLPKGGSLSYSILSEEIREKSLRSEIFNNPTTG